MATLLTCLKISPENMKQLSVKTSSAKRSSVLVEGSLTVRRSKKYLSAKSPSFRKLVLIHCHLTGYMHCVLGHRNGFKLAVKRIQNLASFQRVCTLF